MSVDETPRNPQNPPPRAEESAELERAVAEALAAYVDRVSREETVDIDAFCKTCPGLENELRPLLESLNEMDGLPFSESSALESKEEERLPERLSGHKILGEIGAGGMGRVLLGYDERLNRKVAIKLLGARFRNEESVKTRFVQEARALAQISHPNIVHIFSLGSPEELPHFVMEFVDGVSLVEAGRALTLKQKAELMRKVALAADFLHEHQIVHRDLKPTNILVSADLEPKILDFGLAQHLRTDTRRVTRPGEIMGTPEWWRGGASDIQHREANQSGDLQGLSTVEGADSESVDEFLKEGNPLEADVVMGAEDAGDADGGEVRTLEVSLGGCSRAFGTSWGRRCPCSQPSVRSRSHWTQVEHGRHILCVISRLHNS
jgi:predicted Ser/Thr protein kinase